MLTSVSVRERACDYVCACVAEVHKTEQRTCEEQKSTHTHAHTHAHTHTRTHMHTRTHTRTHTQTNTQTHSWWRKSEDCLREVRQNVFQLKSRQRWKAWKTWKTRRSNQRKLIVFLETLLMAQGLIILLSVTVAP